MIILLTGFTVTATGVNLLAGKGKQVDLVEAKKKEEERRKKTKESKQNFTDKDLEQIKKEKTNITESSPDPNEKTDPGKNNAATPKKDENETPDPKQTEKYWKDRVKAIKDNIKQNQDVIKQEEEKLAKLNTDFSIKPDEQPKIEQERRATFEKIENYKRGIEHLKKDLEDLEDEARKAGVPAGWLRD